MIPTLIPVENETEQSSAKPESHPFSVPELRLFAYAQKFGEKVPEDLAKHLAECAECENWLRILHHTDPVLIGKDEARVASLVRYAEDHITDKQTTATPLKALAATVGDSAGVVANVFRQLFSSDTHRGIENARLKTAERIAAESKIDRRSA